MKPISKAINFICSTVGTGLWSSHIADVGCTMLEITYISNIDDRGNDLEDGSAPSFGEMRVHFDTKTWNCHVHGLIYTDSGFMTDLQKQLMKLGFSGAAVRDVLYSELGMQGDDFVSCDVGGDFLAEASDIFKE